MVKRMVVALVGLIAILGIAAAPASATSSVLVEEVQVWGQVAFGGTGQLLPITDECERITAFDDGAKSAQNISEDITLVFYAEDNCTTPLAVLPPLSAAPVIINPAAPDLGAFGYQPQSVQ